MAERTTTPIQLIPGDRWANGPAFDHQSALHVAEVARAVRGTVQRAVVVNMLNGTVKIIARDRHDKVVCYGEVPRADAERILETLGFDSTMDITAMITTLIADGLSPGDATDAARMLVQP